jgi:hypothetical protein
MSALRRLSQEDYEFKASLGYTERPYLKKKGKHHLCEQLFV